MASRTGKLRQHSNIKPKVIVDNCTFCKRCIDHCPAEAIFEKAQKAFISEDICIGCGDCIAACKFAAITDSYSEDVGVLSEKMVEYSYAVLKDIKQKVFFNFAVHITKNCDCMAKDEPSVVGDVGIFASDDPVACDKAAADAIVKKAELDVFKKGYPNADYYMNQLNYAEQLGLGTNQYELAVIS